MPGLKLIYVSKSGPQELEETFRVKGCFEIIRPLLGGRGLSQLG